MPMSEAEVPEIYNGGKSKTLICHIMINKNKEIAKPIKTKVYAQEVIWKKRVWALEPSRFITDSKGIAHTYLDVNDSATLSFNKDHADKCKQCSGKMTVDAKNARDLVKRKAITALFGVDSMPLMIIIVMAIGLVIMGGAIMYIYGDIQKKDAQVISLNKQLDSYRSLPQPINPVIPNG